MPQPVAWAGGAVAEAAWRLARRTDDPPMTRFLAGQLGTAHWFDLRETERVPQWRPREISTRVSSAPEQLLRHSPLVLANAPPTVLLLAGMLTLTACSSGGSDEGEISASPSVQTLPTDVTDALAAQLTKTMSSNDVPGAAVQVCVPGYENATIVQGVSNIETGTPMTGEFVWLLRSVTKSYTVTLILSWMRGKSAWTTPSTSGWTGFPTVIRSRCGSCRS